MVRSGLLAVVFLVVICCVQHSLCWQEEELEMFDLVEEIGENFYELLEVSQDASTAEIRRSFRRLSLKYHPDKNSSPDAAEKFRIINAVAEVLRDELKRSIYDDILREGLPDWRQPVYYYRRARKMTIYELSLLVLVVATIGQYLVGWAQYFEKWLILQERLERKAKRESRGTKSHKNYSMQLEAEVAYYQQMADESIPRCSKLLPVVAVKKLYQLVIYMYHRLRYHYWMWRASNRTREAISPSQTTPDSVYDVAEVGNKKRAAKSRKHRDSLQTSKNHSARVTAPQQNGKTKDSTVPLDATPTATDNDPEKTTNSSQATNASESNSAPAADDGSSAERETNKLKVEASSSWSQQQQKQLESALSRYSQLPADQRWSAIADAVLGKTKEECIERYKQLVQLVRKRKQGAT